MENGAVELDARQLRGVLDVLEGCAGARTVPELRTQLGGRLGPAFGFHLRGLEITPSLGPVGVQTLAPERLLVRLAMSQERQLLMSLVKGTPFSSEERQVIETMLPHLTYVARRLAEAETTATNLSRREVEVARLVSAGYSNRQVAEVLGVGENTIKKHLTSVLNKLGARNRTQLAIAMLAVEHERP